MVHKPGSLFQEAETRGMSGDSESSLWFSLSPHSPDRRGSFHAMSQEVLCHNCSFFEEPQL